MTNDRRRVTIRRMIRNDRGDHVLLITQHDHAVTAGQLAARLGTDRFDGPDPKPATLLGIELHDAGWPLHDDEPTLNKDGLPLHVLEVGGEVATRVWRESARRAAERDPYAGLLVSLHVFTLSALAVSPKLSTNERFDRREELFLVNQFQQDEIERQEQLREQVGLRTDRPLHIGLAAPGADREEDRLRFNFAWLRAMDAISLDACTGKKVFDKAPPVHPRIGAAAVDLAMAHPSPDVVTVSPWPFAVPRVELEVPARWLAAGPFPGEEAFRQAYAAAERVSHKLTVLPA
jgi:hypothetical protein